MPPPLHQTFTTTPSESSPGETVQCLPQDRSIFKYTERQHKTFEQQNEQKKESKTFLYSFIKEQQQKAR